MASYLGNSPDTILKVRKRNFRYVATSGQTSFNGTDSNGLIMSINTSDVEVFLNGVLLDQTDYTITSTILTLGSGATLNDIVEVITNTAFAAADQYTKQEVDNKVSTAISDLVGTAGSALNTLGELSDALADDANYAATITTALGTKANTSSLATVATSGSYNDLTNKPTIPTVSAAAVSDQANTSTGYFDLPAGTTAERPSSPHVGMSRFNTTTGFPEWYSATLGTWINFADAPYAVEYIIVAGGGSGGSDRGGGGGAGGYLSGTATVSSTTQYSIVLGAGGAGGANTYANGNNTTALGLTAIAGGGGGSPYASAYTNKPNGGNGGSGGGGSSWAPGTPGSGTAGQGNNGGVGGGSNSTAGGGGVAGIAGVSVSGSQAGSGGYGNYDTWSGPRYLAAGGGGAAGGSGSAGSGGTGGGGAGSAGDGNQNAGNASANTGSGGGGATGGGSASSGSGASGIVVIRYAGSQRGTGGTITSNGGYTIHTFTSSGTFIA